MCGGTGHDQPVGDLRDQRLIFGISQLSKKINELLLHPLATIVNNNSNRKLNSVYSQLIFNLINKLSHYC